MATKCNGGYIMQPLIQTENPTPVGATTLDRLALHQAGRILALGLEGAERRRLLDLGFVPGARIEVELENPLGNPRAFRVLGGVVALRTEQAARITIALENPAS
ncbi:MAG: DtxR family transcriptional regulator, Mn-dependent transcriptional regulator [Candidatus Sumerlaeota bacterium]|nr:DtxR family transcriptional regulator, Mn-dependent transcriptional regulator [Candidatus Sumerlaeota bacterium]